MRQRISGTNLFVRNFGRGRSRIMLIEPELLELADYAPIRIEGASIILFGPAVVRSLRHFYARASSRSKRNAAIPGGISASVDVALKRYLADVTLD